MSALNPVSTTIPKRPKVIRPAVFVECVQPSRVADGFAKLLEMRRALGQRTQGIPWVLRDLHEEAIQEFVTGIHNGHDVAILAPSIDATDRKTFRVDAKLRDAVIGIAKAKTVTHSAVYHTAFLHFLKAQGILDRAW